MCNRLMYNDFFSYSKNYTFEFKKKKFFVRTQFSAPGLLGRNRATFIRNIGVFVTACATMFSSSLKFIYSKKATKFCEISNVDLTVTTQEIYGFAKLCDLLRIYEL